ncbi:MAG: hypothetical protein WBM24_12920 [Candidatus Sulfotelmatobacter sp.]
MQHPEDMNAGLQVLRSSRDLKAEGANRQPYKAEADISIRLWTPAQLRPRSPEVSWNTDSNLVCLIADVVAAAQGTPLHELRSGMSAHFNNAVQALKAAKSIERAVTEFSRRRPDDCFGAAIAVHRPVELRPFLEGDAGPAAPAFSLLRQAQPGQILVSRETYDHLRDLPGLQFRSLDPDAGHAAGGDAELLWASPQTYAFFATHLQEALQRQPVPDEPDQLVAVEENRAQPHRTKSSELRTGGFSTTKLSAFDVPENEPSWMSSHRVLVSLGAVGVLALATVYAIPALHKRPEIVNAPVNTNLPVNTNINAVPQTSKPAASQNDAVSPLTHPVQPAKVASAAASLGRKPDSPKTIPPSTTAVEVKPLAEYEGFTAKDVPLLLRKAEADAGAGDYDSSRHEYDIVLHLEPGNQAAKAGLSRVNLSVDRNH